MVKIKVKTSHEAGKIRACWNCGGLFDSKTKKVVSPIVQPESERDFGEFCETCYSEENAK